MLLILRARDQIPVAVTVFKGDETQKRPYTVHLVHVKEFVMAKMNPESATTGRLISI